MPYDIVFSPSAITTYVVRLPSFFKDMTMISDRFVGNPSVFSVKQYGGDVEIAVLNSWCTDIITACSKVDGDINHIVLDSNMGVNDHGIEPVGNDGRPRANYSSIRILNSNLLQPSECGCELMK